MKWEACRAPFDRSLQKALVVWILVKIPFLCGSEVVAGFSNGSTNTLSCAHKSMRALWGNLFEFARTNPFEALKAGGEHWQGIVAEPDTDPCR